jgi:hypothetical protein
MSAPANSSSTRVLSEEPRRPSPAAIVNAVPMRFRIVGGLALAVAALLAAGVQLSALVPFAGLAACLGMHFFMGHGGHRGDPATGGHGSDHAAGKHDAQAD